jgi:hypothetical protein
MPAVDTSISIYKKDYKTLNVTVKDSSGNAIDITGFTFWLTVKVRETDADADAVIQKKVTSLSNPTQGIMQFSLDTDDTDIDVADYQYDIQMKSSAGAITTLVRGTFIILQEITQATT